MAASGTVATFKTSISLPLSSSSSSSQLTHLKSPSKVLNFTSRSRSSFSVTCTIAKPQGGKYNPETLMHAVFELKLPFQSLVTDGDFQRYSFRWRESFGSCFGVLVRFLNFQD
ncbi:hypothetical protein Bca4012_058120 [Brassica carinata]